MLSLFKSFQKKSSPKNKETSEIVISGPLNLERSVADVKTYFAEHPGQYKFSRKTEFGQPNSWIRTHDNSLYKLDKRFARGAEGKIKKAYTEQGELIAVKVIDLNNDLVFISGEIAALSKLGRLKNIATRTLDEKRRRLYIFQTFIHAQPMRERLLSPFQTISSEQRTIIAINYVKALLTLFEQHSIVHGDVKIYNAMVDTNLEVTFVDFGFAKILPEGQTIIEDIATSYTPGYVAPEILQNKHYSPASDIFALGVDFQKHFYVPKDLIASMTAPLPQERPSHRDILRRLRNELQCEKNLSAKGQAVIQEVDAILRTPAVATNYQRAHPTTFTPWQVYKPS